MPEPISCRRRAELTHLEALHIEVVGRLVNGLQAPVAHSALWCVPNVVLVLMKALLGYLHVSQMSVSPAAWKTERRTGRTPPGSVWLADSCLGTCD